MKKKLFYMWMGVMVWMSLDIRTVAQSLPPLTFPAVIGDHMVLQQHAETKFWGWCDPRTTVRIIPSWGTDTIVVKTGCNARFEAILKTPGASSEPYEIKVRIKGREIVLKDILIGEVWLCSGQSNMEWNATKGIEDVKAELPNATDNGLRFFSVGKQTASFPQDDCHGQWTVCSPETLKRFSAVGYFFGKRLRSELNRPVGLINASWGGTNIETWMPQRCMDANPRFNDAVRRLDKSTGWDITPAVTYNAMIHPLLDMKIAGVIWYQGEANLANGYCYADMFTAMIKAWREDFANPVLPFYYVQIAPYARYKFASRAAAQVREQQHKVMGHPYVGMVAVSDQVDNIMDIHPKYKNPVGTRLANWALSETYDKYSAPYRHPSYRRMEKVKSGIRIFFDGVENGLVCRGKEPLTLEIAGTDMNFVAAHGRIDKKNNTLFVESRKVKNPVAVRYSFTNDAVGNLFNREGLPLLPFRTDTLEIAVRENP